MNALNRTIYLDYGAATPLDPCVRDAMAPYEGELFYNPSAAYDEARRVRADLEGARASIAHLIGARAGNVVFTAGATEANNLAFAALPADAHVVTDAIEHESVLACAEPHPHTVVTVGADGIVDPSAIAAAITPATGLVSVSLANGEIGAIQPLRDIARAVADERMRRLEAGEDRPIWLHTDASQAATTLSVNVSSLGVDLMTLSAAKMYGPKQVGALWAADGIALNPLIAGGGQERGLRSGTENVAGAIGFAHAFEIASDMRRDEARRLEGLRRRMERALIEAFPDAVVTGPRNACLRLPGLLHVSFPGVEARRLVLLLGNEGVLVATGSACAASKMRISHVLSALGMDERTAAGSLRMTLGRPTTADEVDAAAEAIIRTVRSEYARLGVSS